jgi:4-aminobutyrate aminotransferase-like enzyme
MFERCGARNAVLKLLPPLNTPPALLREAMGILTTTLRDALLFAPGDNVYDAVHS